MLYYALKSKVVDRIESIRIPKFLNSFPMLIQIRLHNKTTADEFCFQVFKKSNCKVKNNNKIFSTSFPN
jgi:hypothetical protein